MNSALLIIDIQNDYFDSGAMTLRGSDKASLNAKLLLEKFRSIDMPIIHIQHIAVKPAATFFLPDTTGSQIHKNVEPRKTENIIVKHYPNSFRETGLLDYLKSEQITDLVVCGMMTHMCVDSTVRAAKDFGFNCTVIGDACATKDLQIDGHLVKAEDVHNSFLAAMDYFYSKVKTTRDFLENR